ncbi:ribonucleoside-diphosphate reductase subunit alpha [Paraburkholderia nemoris]|uniref:ribonucleoside-diphosphate reductase subunit alpha n=1 Tax=Paraburkholderia nemoris TaxID=2793076 RepID=UPI0038BC15DC
MKDVEVNVIKRNGTRAPKDASKILKCIEWACKGLSVSPSSIFEAVGKAVYDGIKTTDIHRLAIGAAAGLISLDNPDANYVAARLLLQEVYKQAADSVHYPHLRSYLIHAHGFGLLDDRMIDASRFDMERLNSAVQTDRDFLFGYLGLQTLADRYFLREKPEGRIIEMPQHFWMRVAMGVALNEAHPTARAIEFYNILSTLEFVSSTPTLFNSGTRHSQLSSCYGNTVYDSISNEEGMHKHASIFGTIEECANLSKYAGGIGTDWTRVRAEGDFIRGTSGISSGVVPYLKIYNDTAVAVNQGGKRKGSFAPYLEPWHPDFLDFIELKKNTGDERKRAHEIYPAGWMPDLFMKRVKAKGVWSFFSPKQYPELHELYGDAFEARYVELEAAGKFVRQMPAVELWRKWLTMLFETGHPWITYKDEMNRRNPQGHVGVIHNSNLCTEIALNNSDDETFVCNLGSVNLSRCNPIKDRARFRDVVHTAMRMLDNVIDINFYPSERARNSNLKHRPVGLGVMGYMEYLVQNGLDFESQAHLDFADCLFEEWSYYAIDASCELAQERGAYPTFEGSLWSKGILPIDTARGPHAGFMDWCELRSRVVRFGMRNSNCMAIAPTATISNIAGTTPCIEAAVDLVYSKTNLSGDFLVIDPTLKYGRPELAKGMFQIDPLWVVRSAAVRQKYIDQAQSTNIFVKKGTKGKVLAEIYETAWELGLKTTYYLRTESQSVEVVPVGVAEAEVKLCSIDNPECEACQ